MRRIAIMGAGQAGLFLAIRLIKSGYDVTVISEYSAEELFNGPPTGATYLFDDALQLEKEIGLDLWRDTAYHASAFHINLGTPGGNLDFAIRSRTSKPGASIDQRLKFYQWIKVFQKHGGKFIVSDTTPSDLLGCTSQFDLVIISSGKGPLARLFPKDVERSPHQQPARKLVQIHFNDFEQPGHTRFTSITFDAIMGAGEVITGPFYQKDDIQCAFMLMECVPGGPMDVFDDCKSATQILERAKLMMQSVIPWRYPSLNNASVIDPSAFLKGSFTPVVRKPFVKLNSTATVMGLGDTVILNDPIVGQGGNNAIKMAHAYAQAIIEHGDNIFDSEWMERTFESFWAYSQHVNHFCDLFLSPPAHVIDILKAAEHNPEIAFDFVSGFNHPPGLFPWLSNRETASDYLANKLAVSAFEI
ncbi:styrene monooxygenase/indole monooxygenase family protein [Dyadobacter sp. CY347]|uniref:styrene monooxygenase/indole monooxygenase family protein n=1 Tax=Dyadobacter sp. CY347 TaxID=2909336 RepID=UPI001F31DC4D|nr:styrene monooxygenase/indole monooxygenase family protein [Dyadobacter sp. CY347]MCF2491463.1 hypothetical protein [Dyadobacter sp. CY347]